MGIQNYLKRVSKATKDIKSAIEEKGVSVAQCDGFETLADKVRAIQVGSSSDGSTLFTVLAFKSSQDKPATPTGGSFTASAISYPSGWSDGGGLSKYIWMSYIVFKGDGSVYKNWVSPILVNGAIDDSGNPIDLTDLATKTWVVEKIKSSIKDGTIDLSTYATKEYVDSKISTSVSGVSSVNDITGAVTLKGSSSVSITKSGNELTFTASGESGDKDGDSFITVQLFIAHSSYETAPEVADIVSTYDSQNKVVVNPPTGWSTNATKTTEKPYIWSIWGTFSITTGEQNGGWLGPYCITGAPGPAGEDGDEIEEVYTLSNESVAPTINSTESDSNNKNKTDDGYLPKFVFANESKEAVSERPSVSDTAMYCWATKRRKHKGTWLEFMDPYMVSNFVKAGLTDEEKEQIKTDVTNNIKNELDTASQKVTAIEGRLDKIDGTNATYLVDNKEGIIQALTQYKNDNQSSFSDLVLDGSEAKFNVMTGAYIKDNSKNILSGAGLDVDGVNAKLEEWTTFKDVDNMTLSSVRSELDATNTTATTAATKADDAKNSVTNAMTKWDGDKATITSDVSKSRWFWVTEEIVTLSNGETIQKLTKQADYDISLVDGVTYKTVEEYENAMKAKGWKKELVIDALSRISQEAGKITLAANEGSSWASIVAKANKDGNSEIVLDAPKIYMNGQLNGKEVIVTDLTVTGKESDPDNGDKHYGAKINQAYINECEINSCTIKSQIISDKYNNGDNGETKQGFLFDAGGQKFAIYGGGDDPTKKFELTNSGLIIPEATITGALSAASIDARMIKTGVLDVGRLDLENLVVQKLKTKDLGNGTIEIKNDEITLTSSEKNVLTVSGKEIQVSDNGTQQVFSKNISANSKLLLAQTDKTTANIVKNQSIEYSWEETITIGTVTHALNKSIVVPGLPLTFMYKPTFNALAASGSEGATGTISVTVKTLVGEEQIALYTNIFNVYYNNSEGWRFNDGSDSTLGVLFVHPYGIYESTVDSAEISYKISASATIMFEGDYTGGDNGENYDNLSSIYSRLGNAATQVSVQVLPTKRGCTIGSNGFTYNVNSATSIEFVQDSNASKILLENPMFGININSNSLQIKYLGNWYSPVAKLDGNSTVLTFVKS